MDTLLKWSKDNVLSQVTLSSSGEHLFFGDVKLNANDKKVTVNHNDKTVSYTLASIFLQIRDPDQGLMTYRNACKKHSVTDPVKPIDKPLIVGYFGVGGAEPGEEPETTAAEEAQPSQANSEKAAQILADATSDITTSGKGSSSEQQQKEKKPHHRSSSERDKHHHRSDRDKHRSSSSSKHRSSSKDPKKDKRPASSSSSSHHHAKKKQRTAEKVTQEQLLSNLNVVVDKRQLPDGAGGDDNKDKATNDTENDMNKTNNDGDNNDDQVMNQKIKNALSTEGFQVTSELLQQYRDMSQEIAQHEIPVGNSASILRAAKSMNADLTRVLTLYLDATKSKSSSGSSSRSASAKGGKSGSGSGSNNTNPNFKQYLLGKKPIIILPKGMTAPVTMVNGNDFFSKAKFTPRQEVLRNKASQANMTTFTRKTKAGKVIEYELVDNIRKIHVPKGPRDSWERDWERVVAVIVLGQSWQFKDWPGLYSNPVTLFQKTFGYHLRYDGDQIPKELQGWAVKKGTLHKQKRQLDTITHSSFWNALDEWMAIHKPEFMVQTEE